MKVIIVYIVITLLLMRLTYDARRYFQERAWAVRYDLRRLFVWRLCQLVAGVLFGLCGLFLAALVFQGFS